MRSASEFVNRIVRTLFAVKSRQMILPHGFIRKTQQTPSDNLAFALKRFKARKDEERQARYRLKL